MTARPIRYQRQVSDRKGKIFYTSITSLSHISRGAGLHEEHSRVQLRRLEARHGMTERVSVHILKQYPYCFLNSTRLA